MSWRALLGALLSSATLSSEFASRMSKNRSPGASFGQGSGRAGDVREAGQRLDSSNKPGPNRPQVPPAMWSEALCAAGKCIAAVRAGFTPTRIELRLSRNGRWEHWIDGFDPSIGSTIGREIMMAGTAARHPFDSSEPDLVAVLENVALVAALKLKTQTDSE